MSWGEWLVVGILLLLVVGPKKLPEFSRKAGRLLHAVKQGFDEFRKNITLLFFPAFLILSVPVQATHEVSLTVGHRSGFLAHIEDNQLNGALKHFVLINPEAHVDFQIHGPWFAAATFHFARYAGENNDPMHLLAPTAGIKLVSFENSSTVGDFFDRSRFWFGLEAGPYIHQSYLNAVIPRGRETSVGFNASAGFDTFFHDHWAAGFQFKMHYVDYSLDNYFLLTFGPHLTFRF